MRKSLVLILALAVGVLTAGCRCDLCCSTRVPPDPCAPCGPTAVTPTAVTPTAVTPAAATPADVAPASAPARP